LFRKRPTDDVVERTHREALVRNREHIEEEENDENVGHVEQRHHEKPKLL